ncbi:DUF6445 family protein [Novosphingobium sp.]|uniref:DUF6445 family protein n=1 Tax=Novosphingobium sp. TaxID=1874826 RepID=UPI0033421F0D
MIPELRRFGASQSPVVTVDNFCPDLAALTAMAEALAPYPPAINHYPGVRRVVDTHDDGYGQIAALLKAAAPFIAGAYDIDRFDLVEASFSMVTCPPGHLSIVQRAPHFDATTPGFFAVMLYLRNTAGTAFYRHRASGIERVTEANLPRFIAHAKQENIRSNAEYIHDSNPFYERIGMVEGLANRLVIYPGALLHSGVITPGLPLSDDPRTGRLTANLFIRAG